MTIVSLISALGARFPLPATKYFAYGCLGSLVLFIFMFGFASVLASHHSDFFMKPSVGRLVARSYLALIGIGFAGFGMGLLYRLVFSTGGAWIEAYHEAQGRSMNSGAAGMVRRNFADGCIVLFWGIGISGLLIALISGVMR